MYPAWQHVMTYQRGPRGGGRGQQSRTIPPHTPMLRISGDQGYIHEPVCMRVCRRGRLLVSCPTLDPYFLSHMEHDIIVLRDFLSFPTF